MPYICLIKGTLCAGENQSKMINNKKKIPKLIHFKKVLSILQKGDTPLEIGLRFNAISIKTLVAIFKIQISKPIPNFTGLDKN